MLTANTTRRKKARRFRMKSVLLNFFALFGAVTIRAVIAAKVTAKKEQMSKKGKGLPSAVSTADQEKQTRLRGKAMETAKGQPQKIYSKQS